MREKHAIATLASLLADPGRCAMVLALLDGKSLPAGELARAAAVSAQSASAHLAKLSDGGLIAVIQSGRCRYYKLTSGRVANAMEALGAISTVRAPAEYARPKADDQLITARSCYDHLAGKLAVALAQRMEEQRIIVSEGDRDYRVTGKGAAWLEKLGIGVETIQSGKRHTARRCIDWTERRPHVAGALGAALLEYFLAEGWLRRCRDTRALRVTHGGMRGFARMGLNVAIAGR